MKRWVECLACCAWLVDVAREQGSAMPFCAHHAGLWDAERALVATGRRVLHKAEAA